jgi:uncharacterized protein
MITASILVIAKEPVPGRVKTRLCPPCTLEEAAVIAAAALRATLVAVARVPVRRRCVVLDGEPGSWLPPGFAIARQSSGPLDARLAAAFSHVDGPTLLVGMDTPQLTDSLLADALQELLADETDAVLGLAPDGGWWGIGLRDPDGRVFEDVAMSTPETGARQLARLHELGLRTRMLTELRDVDFFADARAVATQMPGTSQFARIVDTVTRAIEARVLEPQP